MRARLLATGVAVLAALFGSSPATVAATASGPPGQYYLSLGDSLAFGYQQDRFNDELANGSYSPANFPGYTYRFGEALQELTPSLQVVDYGCPGETTVSFTTACRFQVGGYALHESYPGSQEAAAEAFLLAHPGEVSPITVSLGVNDVLPALIACAPTFAPDCVAPYITAAVTNLANILGVLRHFAPSAEIIVLQYYDPYYVLLGPVADSLAKALDSGIALAAASAGADTANAFAVFNNPTPKPPATEYSDICKLTLMCSDGDIHASNVGYSVLARIFYSASGYGA